MISLQEARKGAADCMRPHPLALVMTTSEEGLVLGTTVLAPMGHDACGIPALAIDGAEERILALLAVAYGKMVGPAVLGNIRRASAYWSQGETVLAAIELALSGLAPLKDKKEAALRLSIGDRLLAAGASPRELMKACGLDPAAFDLLKAGYDPDQPRVPAGNTDGGQWTSGDDGSATPKPSEPSRAATVLANYTVVREPPHNAKIVIPPDGVPISGGDPPRLLIAPPRADYRQVYAAGQAIASLPLPEQYSRARAAIAQGGKYDFQRDVPQQKFYDAYIPAANYAAGVYMAGAGYSLDTTLALAKLYALRNSSNYDTQGQLGWITRGWTDAKSGRWQ
jgi:hypothetical protein